MREVGADDLEKLEGRNVWNPEVAAEANFFDPRLKVTLGQKKRIRPYDGTG